MRKFLSCLIVLSGMLCLLNAEVKTKRETIDNLYSIEWTVDSESNSGVMKLYSDNSAPYDESYGDECFNEQLESILNEFGYSEGFFSSAEKNTNFENKFTLVTKKIFFR